MPEILVRPMTVEDIDDVVRIEEFVFSHPWKKKSFVSDVADNRFSHYFVACMDGHIIGYSGMWIILDEAHITTMAVHCDYQRRGIGRILLRALMVKASLEGASRMSLEVRPSNIPARRLYASMGYTIHRRRRKYYPDEDALVMMNTELARYVDVAAAGSSAEIIW